MSEAEARELREHIKWYLEQISDERTLKRILAAVARLFVGRTTK